MADATATRTRKASKRWHAAKALVESDKVYQPLEAFGVLKSLPDAKFDETVEAKFKLGLDVRKADQMLRSTLTLPHGTGKTVTVAVFAQGEKAAEAEAAGADFVGNEELAEKIQGGWTDFDVCIATPDLMATVGKLGRILGPRNKMPNPKTGTVTFDVAAAVSATKGGKIDYRTDRYGIVHVVLGLKSFTQEQLTENYATVLEEVLRVKPASAKGRYIQSIGISATMSPGIKVDASRTRDLMDAQPEG